VVGSNVKCEEEFTSRKPHESILVTEDEELESPKVEPESLMT
jgi:hypothetical protein